MLTNLVSTLKAAIPRAIKFIRENPEIVEIVAGTLKGFFESPATREAIAAGIRQLSSSLQKFVNLFNVRTLPVAKVV